MSLNVHESTLINVRKLSIIKVGLISNTTFKERGTKMKKNKPSFEQLVRENKQKLLNDQRALDELEERLEKKLEKRFLEKLS